MRRNSNIDSRSEVSSSQMENGDVTLICHKDDLALTEQIEVRLSGTYKVLPYQCIAGRGETPNLMSRIHHAKFKIVIMSDEHGEKLGDLLQRSNPEYLLGCTTLVLYQNNEPTTQLLRGQIQVKVPVMDVNESAKAVTRFIEAHKEAENEAQRKDDEKWNLYISLLCAPFLEKSMDSVLTLFKKEFGNFQMRQFPRFVDFTNYSYILEVRKKVLRFSKNGRLVYKSWATRVEDKLRLQDFHHQSPKSKSEEWLDNHESQLTQQVRTESEMEGIKSMRNILQKLEGRGTGCFLVSDIQNTPGDVSAIANVPWLRVFDFDVKSRESGLLNQLEPKISERAEIQISAFSDDISSLNDSTTDWLFMKGMCENQDSVHSGEFMDWKAENEETMNTIFREMADYCCPDLSPVFLVLWYNTDDNTDEESFDYLEEMLSNIRKGFSDGSKNHSFPVDLWVCTSKPTKHLQRVLKKYKVLSRMVIISLADINDCLSQMTPPNTISKGFRLPGINDNGNTATIDVKRDVIRRINQTLEILPIDHVISEELMKQRETKMYGKSFLQGGEVTWDHLSYGQIAIDRDAQDAACEQIRCLVNNRWRSTVVELHHGPGGGGSTFARQLLWKLRQDAPCISVKMPCSSISEVLLHLKDVYELTHMPVIVLLDGGSDSDVQTLLTQRGIELLILHVSRYYENLNELYPKESELKLSNFVSPKEATNLSNTLVRFSPDTKNALDNLNKEVNRCLGVQLYEFGLTAFSLDYEGIRSYITGYMAPSKTPLLSWQKTVAFLSLLLYYGEVGISKNTFRNLLGVAPKSVDLNDLPFKGQQFITESSRGEWKMIYSRVAKEILEYVLVSPEAYGNQQTGETLSAAARKELPDLVIDFIRSVKAEVGSLSPPSIVLPLTKMIIRRGHQPTRQRYSRLLHDVESVGGRPEIIAIVETLAEAFPDNSEIQAYLGKQYGFAHQFDKAEKTLTIAVKLARKKCSDDVTGRTHNTFGYSYHKHVNHLIRQNDIPNALLYCRKGINQFQQASKLVANNFSYGYLGEIKIRLLMAEYVHNRIDGGCQASIDGTLDVHDVGLAEIVRESFYECKRLLKESKSSTKPSELRKIEDYSKCVNDYNMFYNEVRPDSIVFKPENIHQNVPAARRVITQKMNLIETMKNSCDQADLVKELVLLYDVLLHGILSKGVRVNTSIDMFSWLRIMRHADAEDTYEIASMVKLIEQWNERNEKWGYAPVYLYACRFLLAIYKDDSVEKRRENLNASTKLRDSFRSGRIAHYDKTIEMLGAHKSLTMKKLIPRKELGIWDDGEKMWSNQQPMSMLQVCTGNIISPKEKRSSPSVGWISVELKKPIGGKMVDVYFNPKKYSLHARSNAENRKRVEFFIGFHTYNGAEAHCVRLLEQQRCPHCGVYSDIITLRVTTNVKCKKCSKILPECT